MIERRETEQIKSNEMVAFVCLFQFSSVQFSWHLHLLSYWGVSNLPTTLVGGLSVAWFVCVAFATLNNTLKCLF